jgi:hypothetical protein
VGTEYVIAPDDYCREIEAYLCRKNDGHLIRIVGPAFEQVSAWASEGIPLKVAMHGVDRYFERYYRKGPRRRPVRIEFCEADVRDAFHDWRRAVGVAVRAEQPAALDSESPLRRSSTLAAHIERTAARLTTLRGSTRAAAVLSDQIDAITRRLDAMQADAKRARGDARSSLLLELEALERKLTDAALVALGETERTQLSTDAAREIEPFRSRMERESFAKALTAAYERLVREHFGLPSVRYE